MKSKVKIGDIIVRNREGGFITHFNRDVIKNDVGIVIGFNEYSQWIVKIPRTNSYLYYVCDSDFKSWDIFRIK